MVLHSIADWHVFSDLFERRLHDCIVYGDRAGEVILHEGEALVLPNGWVELPSRRLLSPEAVHHIDRFGEE